jgi:hypothetical protein
VSLGVPVEVPVVDVDVVVFVVPFFVVSSPQPTSMPKPNSKANAQIFFISSTSNQEYFAFSAGTFPSSYLRSRGLGFYSRPSYNFFQYL